MFKRIIPLILLITILGASSEKSSNVISFNQFGGKANSKENASVVAVRLIDFLQSRDASTPLTVKFPKGRYDFYEDGAFEKVYYISNHDQVNPKKIGFAIEDLSNITIDGQGSEFVFHGRMIPFALLNSSNITLKNFSIDYEVPALRQLNVLEVDKVNNKVIVDISPKNNYRVDNNKLILLGETYELEPVSSMGFREDKRLTYKRGDLSFNPKTVSEIAPNKFILKDWYQINETTPGERFVLRSYYRPTPGVFVSECLNTVLKNVQVHYAEGMGLIAQMSENITLDRFSV